MKFYRWSGNEREWTEFAILLRNDTVVFVENILPHLQVESGCEITIEREFLQRTGSVETFLRFVRGSTGDPTNECMDKALRMFSDIMSSYLEECLLAETTV